METEKNCLICNKSNFRVVHSFRERIHNERFYILQCRNCHFVFTTPLLCTKELSRFYPTDYYSFIPKQGNSLLPVEVNLKSKISRELRMLLLRDVYNYDFETRSFVSAFFRAFLPIYRYLYSEVYPENKNSGRILDVGCGCGEYMLNLKKLEWQVYGVDSNKKAVINAKTNYGLDVFCGEVLNSSFPDNFFDAVTMHAVLEHISEPIDALKEVHRILKERGELIISVPNIWNWERTFFGKFWWAWDIPRHLWHFSPTSLKRLLKKAGFGDIKIRHKADMYDFPGNMKNMLKDIFPQHAFLNVLGEKDKLRFITKYLMMPIGVISALLGVSEQFVIFARK